MDIKFFSKGLTTFEEQKLQDYFAKKVRSFEKLLSHFSPDSVSLQVNSQRHEKHNAFNVEIVLKMPSKTIVGHEASHTLEKAIDLAKDRVVQQIKKHEQTFKVRQHRSLEKPMHQMTSEEVEVS